MKTCENKYKIKKKLKIKEVTKDGRRKKNMVKR